MNCERVREQLNMYVLDGLDPCVRGRLEQHLLGCPKCRSAAKTAADIISSLEQIAESADSEARLRHLTRRVSMETRRARLRKRLRRVAGYLTTSAALLMTCVGTVWYLRRPVNRGDLVEAQALVWTHSGIGIISGNDVTYPAVSGDTVIVTETGPAGRELCALDRHTGEQLWHMPLRVDGCSVVVGQRKVFAWRHVDGAAQRLSAFGLKDGALLWEWEPELGIGAAGGGRLVVGDTGVCWTAGNRVTLICSETGRLLWTRCTGRRGASSIPVVSDTMVYVASSEWVQALDIHTGDTLWLQPHETVGSPFMPPLLKSDGSRLVVAQIRYASDSQLTCYERMSGTLRWRQSVSAPIHSITMDGDLYVRSDFLQAFSGRSGKLLWQTEVIGCSPVTLAGGCLYAVEGRNGLLIVALDPKTGSRLGSQRVSSSCTGLVVVGGMGFLGAHDGALYALDMEWRS